MWSLCGALNKLLENIFSSFQGSAKIEFSIVCLLLHGRWGQTLFDLSETVMDSSVVGIITA
jgi:hypothetical protein